MPFDIVAFLETQTATALSPVAAVSDDFYRTSGDDLFVQEYAPNLAGLLQIGVSTPKYAQIRQPSLKVPYGFYKSALSTDIDHRAGFTNMMTRPLPLKAGEKMNAYVQNASAEYSVIVAWLASGAKNPIPPRTFSLNEAFRITGYADSTLVANVWNKITMTWDSDLPEGRYAVLSMKAGTYLAAGAQPIAARIVLLDSLWRQGVITNELTGDKIEDISALSEVTDQEWGENSEFSFKHDQMPKIEFLSLTADTDHIV